MSMLEVAVRLQRAGFELAVDTQMPGRGVTALFGPSGCGKSTLLNHIAGIDITPGARIRLGETPWQDAATAQLVPTHARGVGYVFQQAHLFPHLDVRGNLRYAMRRVRDHATAPAFDDDVDWLGIAPLLGHRPQQLSGGQRQRVAIARALLGAPCLLLLDEPLGALDARARAEILPYLRLLHNQLDIPMIYVSHDIAEVAQLADHIVLMNAGRIEASGTLNEVLTRSDLPAHWRPHLGTVLEGVVGAALEPRGPSEVTTALGTLLLPTTLPAGARLRLRLAARDVSLMRQPPQESSVLNVLDAVILEITEASPTECLVRLERNGTPLLARITRYSVDKLRLTAGETVYALIKATALAE